jgi:tetratricopeptide (TPR) repeat protein
VDAVLDGRVQRSEGTVRVTVQLVNSKDGSPIWAEKFDEAYTNVFAAQDAVASRVTLRLAPVLTAQERDRQARRYTDSPEAYEDYLKGRYFWNKRTTESFRKSIDYFHQAIQKDPAFALAYVGLADACAMDAIPGAEPALRKALELDDTLGEAHASFGFYRSFWQMDWAGAEHEFRQAIELSPNYPSAHQWYALCLAAQGRLDQAKAEMAQALEIDPLSPNFNADMGQIYYFARQYDVAIAFCEKALEMDSDFAPAHRYLSRLYIEKEMHAQAVEEFLKAEDPRGLQPWKVAYEKYGWRGFLQSVVKTFGHANPVLFHAQLGNKRAALDDLEKTYNDGYLGFLFIKVDPLYDELLAEPRFQNLLRRVGLGA